MPHVDRENPCGYCVFSAFPVLVALLCAFSRTNTGLHGHSAEPLAPLEIAGSLIGMSPVGKKLLSIHGGGLAEWH